MLSERGCSVGIKPSPTAVRHPMFYQETAEHGLQKAVSSDVNACSASTETAHIRTAAVAVSIDFCHKRCMDSRAVVADAAAMRSICKGG